MVPPTKFFEYVTCQVLPQLHEVESADLQAQLLKFQAECSLHTGKMADPKQAANNIFQRLLVRN